MSEQRIDSGADAASSTTTDPTEGQGLSSPGAHLGGLLAGGSGDTDESAVPQGVDSRPDAAPGAAPGADAEAPDTEGARFLSETTAQAQAQRS